ncbi:CBS domain-containing protein [Rickettsiales bacterium]|nr:CBS domain-containing protein [Rickettsiales bacterium]
MSNTKVKDVMTENPSLIKPETSLKDAAKKMQEVGCGVLPVGSKSKLLGIITDRDIVIRAIAEGADIKTELVEEYMSDRVYTCNENNTLNEAAEIMGKHKISRLVVENEDGRIVGILSLGCMLRNNASAKEIVAVVEQARGCKAA